MRFVSLAVTTNIDSENFKQKKETFIKDLFNNYHLINYEDYLLLIELNKDKVYFDFVCLNEETNKTFLQNDILGKFISVFDAIESSTLNISY